MPPARPVVETLALDVDGVLLDPERHGAGNWSDELDARFGIARPQLRDAFFTQSWDDVINGRRPIEDALAEALELIDGEASVDDVLECWFDADFAVIDRAVALARHATDLGIRVVLATNQEHRRAAYLRRHLGADIELSDVIYSADLGCQKHEPAFFELASERLNLSRDRRSSVLFVDDVEHNVEVARAAGWQAMHAPPGAGWIDEAEATLTGLS
jgi:putative hydrolase of the HAD superfamily